MPTVSEFGQNSLSRRQALWVVIVALVAGLMLSIGVVLRDYWQTRQSIEKSAHQILDSVEAGAVQAAYTLDKDLAGDILAGLLKFDGVGEAHLTSEHGQLLAVRVRQAPERPAWETSFFGDHLVFSINLVHTEPQQATTQNVGKLEIVVNGGDAARAYFQRVGTEALMGLLRTGMLAWLMLWISQRLVTGPLRDVARSLESNIDTASGNVKMLAMPATHERDEIGILVVRINKLLSDVAQHVQEREANIAALARANAELTRLGEVMAHHFQEPARRLTSFAQRLLSQSSAITDPDSRQSLYFIDTQAKRLSELVRDAQRYLALDHAKVGTTSSANSGAVLRHCIAVASEKPADAEIVLMEPLPTVRLAEKFLRELFTILLDNALRYRDSHRPLRIEVSATIQADRAVFRFADNGSGIAPEYREQVLGLFTRLVPNTIPGTGMGLALAYKMISLAGGHFQIEDGIEGGTGIVFDLPLEVTT
ncbi:MAG: hypothetical protein K2Q11_11610 [Burkholderiaceae bacterium]|nr:hypothetical protein [Burkholderiaceae bacterium]